MNLVELCGFGNECGKAELTVDQTFLQNSLVWEIYKLPNLHSKERTPQGAATLEIL